MHFTSGKGNLFKSILSSRNTTYISSGILGPTSSICNATPGKSASNSEKTESCRSSFSGPDDIEPKNEIKYEI